MKIAVHGGIVRIEYQLFDLNIPIAARLALSIIFFLILFRDNEVMHARNIQRLQDELGRLMLEQIESLKRSTFIGRSKEEMQRTEARLKQIPEPSADLLAALKMDQP